MTEINQPSMKTPRMWAGAALGLCALMAGCSNPNPNGGNPTAAAKNAGNFATTVFLGDSLTAGFQNGSLLDTQQPHGWAPLVGTQAGFTVVQPLIAPPGTPAVLHLKSVGPPAVVTRGLDVTTGRDNPTVQATGLAVPGALVNDVLNTAPSLAPTTPQEMGFEVQWNGKPG